MIDILIGILIILAISTALFGVTIRLAPRLPTMLASTIAIAACAFLVVFSLLWHDNLGFARWLPWTNVIVLADARVPAVAILAGLLWRRIDGPDRRKLLFLSPLIAIALVPSARLVWPRSIVLGNRWKEDVCLQTSHATCSAAAGATLLRALNINSNESEMARLALTTPDGTSVLGLYRGLRLKTAGLPFWVRPFHGDIASLKMLTQRGPVILSVGLRRGARVDPRYERSWGWQPGLWHTVVLFGFDEGGWPIVGDPAVGRERWSESNLDVLWHGDGIQVVRQ